MNYPYRLLRILLVITALPLATVIALVVLFTSGKPILFRQRRIGKHGKPFLLYKFRTMVINAHRLQSQLRARNESTGPTFKIRHDPRFTPVGRFLSHTGLDELPQLWNVLVGDMALIGPRPLPEAERTKLAAWMRERERILPGLISPAILTGKYHKDFDAWMKSDVAYVKGKSVRTDARLMMQILPFLLRLLAREMQREDTHAV